MNTREPDQLTPENELRDLFAARRPNAQSFRDGVARRIAEAERASDGEATPQKLSPWRSVLVRRAAAVLPPEVAFAMFGGAKALPSLLALPALVFATVIAAFVAGARSLARSSRDAAPASVDIGVFGAPPRAFNARIMWGHALMMLVQFSSLLVIFSPFLVGRRHTVDVVIAVMLVSMGALVVTVSGFARAGLLRREQVARLCATLLGALFCGCFLWSRSFHLTVPDSELGYGWSSLIVLLAFAVTAVLARGTTIAPRFYAGFVIASTIGVLFVLPPWGTRSSSSDLRAFLTDFEADTSKLTGWTEAGATFETLRATGAEVPELESMRTSLRHAIESGADIHPIVLTVAARMDLIDHETWCAFAERKMEAYGLDQLLSVPGPVLAPWYDEYRLSMLLATRSLDAAQRAHITDRFVATWPTDNTKNALSVAVQCVRAFDLLDRADLVAARRAQIDAILRRHWVSGRDSRVFDIAGGFSSFPDQVSISIRDATWDGAWLIARIGAPEGIELRALRAHLHSQSLAFGLFTQPWASLYQLDRASLALVERGIGLPPRSWVAALFGERLLITTLLIVALCFAAIRWAAPSGEAALASSRTGAMP